MCSTHSELFIRTQNFRNHWYTKQFESAFARDSMARNMHHTYDLEAQKNLSHKQSVLFYGGPSIITGYPYKTLNLERLV